MILKKLITMKFIKLIIFLNNGTQIFHLKLVVEAHKLPFGGGGENFHTTRQSLINTSYL
jgi:hypothetical protein